MRPSIYILLFAVASLSAGCASRAVQIQAESPRPVVLSPEDDAQAEVVPRTSVTFVLEEGETDFPDEVSVLRFRVAEVWLRSGDDDWLRRRAESGEIRLAAGQATSRTLAAMDVPTGSYDEIALIITDVYAEYGPNAGGPLTVPGDVPVRIQFPLVLQQGTPTTVSLQFEPGASLSRDAECLWHFVPFVVPSVESV